MPRRGRRSEDDKHRSCSVKPLRNTHAIVEILEDCHFGDFAGDRIPELRLAADTEGANQRLYFPPPAGHKVDVRVPGLPMNAIDGCIGSGCKFKIRHDTDFVQRRAQRLTPGRPAFAECPFCDCCSVQIAPYLGDEAVQFGVSVGVGQQPRRAPGFRIHYQHHAIVHQAADLPRERQRHGGEFG